MIWKPIPESVLLIIQFPHDFIIPFPLHHSHFCNTSFGTYWNLSPPPLMSHSLSHLRILLRAAQHLQSIPHPTAGWTPGAGKFGWNPSPECPEQPGFPRGGVLHFCPIYRRFFPSLWGVIPAKSRKIQDPHQGDAGGSWDVTAALDVTWEGGERGRWRPDLCVQKQRLVPGCSQDADKGRQTGWMEMNCCRLQDEPFTSNLLPLYICSCVFRWCYQK